MRALAPLLALAMAVPATAAERRLSLGSFDRIRVEGAFEVTLAIGRSPGGTVKGDAQAVEGVEVRQDGTTLVVRPRTDGARGAPLPDDKPPLSVVLATPSLAGAVMLGGGRLALIGGKARRLDLSVTGAGAITSVGTDAELLNATVIGNGSIIPAGRATAARLLVNGAGTITADKLDAGDLTVRLDGPGEVAARARYTATVTNVGLGRVAVAGNAKCVVRSLAGGSVRCGVGR